MTYSEFYSKINSLVVRHADDYQYIGVRFEDKERNVGDALENSKHNPDREDERDFPEFGTEEYDSLPELGGTSAWLVYDALFDFAEDVDASKICALKKSYYETEDDEMLCGAKHAYLIGGQRCCTHSDADYGEIVIENAVVIAVLR